MNYSRNFIRRHSTLAGAASGVNKSMSVQSIATPAGMLPPATGKKQDTALQRKLDQRTEMRQLATDLLGTYTHIYE